MRRARGTSRPTDGLKAGQDMGLAEVAQPPGSSERIR